MSHVRKQLRDAVAAAVADLPTTGSKVFPGRTWPIEDGQYPALLVYARGGPSRFDAMAGRDAEIPLERQEDITIEGVCRTRGEEPDETLDQIAAEVEAAMMTDDALAALVVRRELVQTDIATGANGEKRDGAVKLTYRLTCYTPAGDPGTLV
ncbi:MAG: hypothetical protein U1E23_14745 [Reyranellaceae bacterium]